MKKDARAKPWPTLDVIYRIQTSSAGSRGQQQMDWKEGRWGVRESNSGASVRGQVTGCESPWEKQEGKAGDPVTC